MGAANNISVVQTVSIRGTNQQTDTGLLWLPPGVKVWSPPSNLGVSTFRTMRNGIWVRAHELANRSGQTSVVAIGGRISNEYWRAGEWTDLTTTYTDDTTDAQSAVANSFDLTTTTNNDGFIVASLVPFNWLSFNVTTAEAGGASVHEITYSKGAAWSSAFTILNAATAARTVNGVTWTAGEVAGIWSAPADWTTTLSGIGTGVPTGYYAIRVRATTASAGAGAKAGGIEIGQARILSSLTNNSIWEVDVEDYWMPQSDGLVACNFPAAGTTYTTDVYAEVGSR